MQLRSFNRILNDNTLCFFYILFSETEAKMIAQRYVDDALMINAKPVEVKVLVLVTNVSPLRAYIYEGNEEISESDGMKVGSL